ncbi:chromosome partition protein Smc [Agaricicola taiwanensis]|uniref:Chromosome partition protein Smc n=1 Tax=Agaricicola taiwanensis TaxID=591372 RepID=A0A8J2YFU3_9RHOB|nr:AAA family ATPase [Agaricicola taiwanensis]GGE34820.1 chromosome partition protein Smc [Agaricicola taiwanensis]
MKLTRLRLHGFKSFVDQSDFLIEPGLTGIVGPNGCGKSNLVEGLRWVMGESSHKTLRAAEMDDVIFAGSKERPARNVAEVGLTLDNSAHEAPQPWTAEETLEVARRVERGKGSSYRINGREVRARDVQILFADASTGARSPSLVRQGQVGEIINAKPEARRRVLEEAAGIAGLHVRRHEAELRLRSAEQNLLRVEDVVGRLTVQIESLKRQARHAGRYRQISAEIRRLEAVVLERAYAAAVADAGDARRAVEEAERLVAEELRHQGEAARAEGVAAHAVPPLRETAAGSIAAVERIRHAINDLDREEKQAASRLVEVERQLGAIAGDMARGEALLQDAAASLERLAGEEAALGDDTDGAAAEAVAETRWQEAERARVAAEKTLSDRALAAAERRAAQDALVRAERDATDRAERLTLEIDKNRRLMESLEREQAQDPITALAGEAEQADAALAQAEATRQDADAELQRARDAELAAAAPLKEAEAELRRYEVERDTLARLVAAGSSGDGAPLLNELTVEPGWETALGAALAEALDAPKDRWRALPPLAAVEFPQGAIPIAGRVKAPAELARRLAFIAVVRQEDGAGLQDALAPGQSLVSFEGDLWRWDGFTAASTAPSRAALKLAERNRLAEVEGHVLNARQQAEARRRDAEKVRQVLSEAQEKEKQAARLAQLARQRADALRTQRAAAERSVAERTASLAGIAATIERLQQDLAEAEKRRADVAERRRKLPEAEASEVEGARQEAEKARSLAADLNAARQSIARERTQRQARRASITAERRAWQARQADATAHLDTLAARKAEHDTERTRLVSLPDDLGARRRALLATFDTAEQEAREASDRLSRAEALRIEAERVARAALSSLSQAREALARAEARHDAMKVRVGEAEARLRETLGRGPAGVPESETALDDLMAELDSLKRDRERLGAVNLRAEDELVEVQMTYDSLSHERDDLNEAIRQLRQAIQTLNREGRERLDAAFTEVNAHFERLFVTLFGGGEAHLTLVESDDPLQAGLEIMARPPGKKSQTLSLLSGGEQTLTALALIFAIFLTNPAPICVLDEVDAPLDDANVERFCHLLKVMSHDTATRFMIVTHNPVTMSHMARLFGVTMAERGVSQLVSVDLEAAEQLREAV